MPTKPTLFFLLLLIETLFTYHMITLTASEPIIDCFHNTIAYETHGKALNIFTLVVCLVVIDISGVNINLLIFNFPMVEVVGNVHTVLEYMV
jgi:hypothetical protein